MFLLVCDQHPHQADIWGKQPASASQLQPLPLDNLRPRISSRMGFPHQGVNKHPRPCQVHNQGPCEIDM